MIKEANFMDIEEKTITYPVDKVNRKLFREGKNIGEKTAKWGRKYITASKIERETLEFGELPGICVSLWWGVNLDNQETECRLSKALSPLAKEIYLAIDLLWKLGFRKNVTVYMIYKILGYKGKPKPTAIKMIWETLNDLRQTMAIISNKSEIEKHKTAKKIEIIDAQLLYFERYSKNDKTDFSINIPVRPFLTPVAEERGHVRSIDIRVLKLPFKGSEGVRELKFYLIEAILNSRSPTMSDMLKWETLFSDLEIINSVTMHRTRKYVKKILSYYELIGFISSFTLTSRVITFLHPPKKQLQTSLPSGPHREKQP